MNDWLCLAGGIAPSSSIPWAMGLLRPALALPAIPKTAAAGRLGP